ncbi:MAG TPA: TonB family protein [Gammaproteobacteria bacterium]|nr:TonB family protein [Gammaproteobacteria bacterium]
MGDNPKVVQLYPAPTTVPPPPPITDGDRLGLTLFFAAVLHAILILGVSIGGFDAKRSLNDFSPIEITLVTRASEKAPEKPDYLAQFNQEGGGNTDEPVAKPEVPPPVTPPPTPAPVQELPTPPQPALMPPPPNEPQVSAPPAPPEVAEPAKPEPEPPKPAAKRKGKTKAKKPVLTAQATSDEKTAAESVQAPSAAPPSAQQLINRSLEIASLSAQINDATRAYAQRPKQKFISAKTQEYKYASYMEAWRAKVERIGNLNYPDEAKRRNLSGSLILDVALNPDGSITEDGITVRRSSGEKILDDAAIRIVRLAAPYAPFPQDIRKETDILHITRTWQFLRDHRLRSR